MLNSTPALATVAASIIATAALPAHSYASGNAFSFWGELHHRERSVSGSVNLTFTLFASERGGDAMAEPLTVNDLHLNNGSFVIDLDFGVPAFTSPPRWIEVAVDGNALQPRQPITFRAPALPEVDADDDAIADDIAPLAVSRSGGFRLSTTAFSVPASEPFITMSGDGDGSAGTRSHGWHLNGDDIFYNWGNVGIATNNPNFLLDVRTSNNNRLVQVINQNNAGRARAIFARTNSTRGWAIHALAAANSGDNAAINAETKSKEGVAGMFINRGGTGNSERGSAIRAFAAQGNANHLSTVTLWPGAGEFAGPNGIVAASSASTGGAGVIGLAQTLDGIGVWGRNTAGSGTTYGVYGQVASSAGYAGFFQGRGYFSENVGLGVPNPSFRLHLSTDSAAKPTSNAWTISSDERLKTNINTIERSLEQLLALRGVTYQWIDPSTQGGMDGTYTGLIAQEIEKVFPEWIRDDANGYKTLTVIGFEGLVVEAMRDLRNEKDDQIDALTQRIAELEELVQQLAQVAKP